MVAYHDDEWGVPIHDDRRAIRAARARVVPGRPVVVDDPAQARGVPGGVPRLRPGGRRRLRRRGPGAPDGRRRDRPQPRQDRRDDRQRRGCSSTSADEFGSFDAYLATIVPPPPQRDCRRTAVAGDIPATTPVSDALSADLRRRGFRFVGSTIVYAFMQSVGLVDDHLPDVFSLRRRGRDSVGVTGPAPDSGQSNPNTGGPDHDDHDRMPLVRRTRRPARRGRRPRLRRRAASPRTSRRTDRRRWLSPPDRSAHARSSRWRDAWNRHGANARLTRMMRRRP